MPLLRRVCRGGIQPFEPSTGDYSSTTWLDISSSTFSFLTVSPFYIYTSTRLTLALFINSFAKDVILFSNHWQSTSGPLLSIILWLHSSKTVSKITNITHCSPSYQYNFSSIDFSASDYTFESFAMVSPKERPDYNIKQRLNRATPESVDPWFVNNYLHFSTV